MTSTLRRRLLVSHLAVALVGVAVLVGIGMIVGDTLLSRQRRMNGGMGMRPDTTSDAVASILPSVLIVGGLAAVIAAGVAAILVTRSIMGPLSSIQEASRRIADGDYAQRVPTPKDSELAAVAHDIDALAHRLAETEARRSHLIDEVAHEMRTPLTTIKGSMEALLDEVVEPGPEVYARVADEASRLQRLAEDLSTLSRAEEHSLSLHASPIDVANVAADVAARMRTQFEHAGVALAVEGGPGPTVGDPQRLAQVLVNLVGNALGHTGQGGKVTVTSGSDATTSWVSVADSGPGIAPEELDRIFERFYRVPDASTPGGRGIGLTIARSLVQAHGGTLTAASKGLGHGATFTMRLPRGD
ncbi:sensor histidine kinase [Demequina lutea]|uniref:Sensor-like histidine kinase SenX3 n=1 Tax=Demequina lutea TaxID=431489 RepID=A0A7Z0CIK2_9MICO|nr:HAMP domain-containing sensor histidine kinase [Demequina lutea]NYI40048.1 signal transduction histidine kinase [Demequina lutea]